MELQAFFTKKTQKANNCIRKKKLTNRFLCLMNCDFVA